IGAAVRLVDAAAIRIGLGARGEAASNEYGDHPHCCPYRSAPRPVARTSVSLPASTISGKERGRTSRPLLYRVRRAALVNRARFLMVRHPQPDVGHLVP